MSIIQTIKNFIARLGSKAEEETLKGKRQLWWIDNKIGGYDGYELAPDGKLYLLNWDLFTGIRWEMSEQGLYTEIVYKKNGNVLKETAQVLTLTDQQMVLKTVTKDNEFINTYIKIVYGTVADKFYGHYTNGESYVQVIPLHEYKFQVVFSEHDKAEVVKYYGDFDSATQILQFWMEGKEIILQHMVNGNTEELTVGSRKYYRPVM